VGIVACSSAIEAAMSQCEDLPSTLVQLISGDTTNESFVALEAAAVKSLDLHEVSTVAMRFSASRAEQVGVWAAGKDLSPFSTQ
jgi:hypothetical protein